MQRSLATTATDIIPHFQNTEKESQRIKRVVLLVFCWKMENWVSRNSFIISYVLISTDLSKTGVVWSKKQISNILTKIKKPLHKFRADNSQHVLLVACRKYLLIRRYAMQGTINGLFFICLGWKWMEESISIIFLGAAYKLYIFH